MRDVLITTTIIAFGILLLVNVFFRLKTFRTFKKLAEYGVSFSKEHVFDKTRMEKEIIAKYPNHRQLILSHVNSMKLSFRISTLCMAVLTICGGVLLYYR
jgi:hypothetical protein